MGKEFHIWVLQQISYYELLDVILFFNRMINLDIKFLLKNV